MSSFFGFALEILQRDQILLAEPMSNHTSFKIGGPADFVLTPKSIQQVLDVILLCKREKMRFVIMGNGSNMLVSDFGIAGAVIKLAYGVNGICVDREKGVVNAESGALLSQVANAAYAEGLSGFEFAAGIPGTVGAAVRINAGAYDGEMKDVVVKTTFLDNNGLICTLDKNAHEFDYRKSVFSHNKHIILKSEFLLQQGEKSKIKDRMDDLACRRRDKQPLTIPSAGSAFKRPAGAYASALIEQCGLKGYSIGGAQVSPKHAGFIVNTGGATANDVLALIAHVQDQVKRNTGFVLHTEVEYIE